MNSPLGILVLLLAMVAMVFVLSKFASFWKTFWFEKRIDLRSLAHFVIALVVFLSIFFFMKENPKLLDIKVNQAKSAKIKENTQ